LCFNEIIFGNNKKHEKCNIENKNSKNNNNFENIYPIYNYLKYDIRNRKGKHKNGMGSFIPYIQLVPLFLFSNGTSLFTNCANEQHYLCTTLPNVT